MRSIRPHDPRTTKNDSDLQLLDHCHRALRCRHDWLAGLIPFVLSLMLTGLTPIVQWLSRRLKCPEWMTILLTPGWCCGFSWLVGLGRTIPSNRRAKTDEFEARLTGVYDSTHPIGSIWSAIETTSVKSHLQSRQRQAWLDCDAFTHVLSDSFLVIFFMIYLLQVPSAEAKTSLAGSQFTRVRQYLPH